jgi:hypothetical protein
MNARCIQCSTEIEEGPLCADCAPPIEATIKALAAGRKREAKKPTFNAYNRETPLRPITLPPVWKDKR